MTTDIPRARKKMIQEHLVLRGITDERVLAAMEEVPRERFLPPDMRDVAYVDQPLPIGLGQTISQPFIVAHMTQALDLAGNEKVLEIGTGCGYQAAVLARLAHDVYTVELIPELGERARALLDALGFTNVHYKIYDGTMGWPENGPYEAVIVTAGAPNVPRPLVDQLADDGRMVIPVGNRYAQDLLKISKQGGKIRQQSLGPCRFVALKGEYGW